MICDCDNKIKGGTSVEAKIKHVHGNVLRLAIPLTVRTIELVNDELVHTDTDFIPSSEYPVNVVFSKGAVNVAFNATMVDGSVAFIEEKGEIPVGVYDITVTCNDDEGNPYRFKQKATLQVVDATIDAGIETPIEYEVKTWYLDAALYLALKGEDGVGIEDIITESSGDIGGFNYVTILLTNGQSKTFTVMNGSGVVDDHLNIDSPHPVSNSVISSVLSDFSDRINGLVANASYNSQTKTINFYSRKNVLLSTIDARPFVKDGMINNVYISNNTLVITFNTDAGREAIGVPLSSIFNPNNYYNRTQVNSLFYNKSEIDALLESKIQQTYIRMDSDGVPPIFYDAANNVITHANVIALFDDPSKNIVLHCEFEYEDTVYPCNLSLASIENESQYKMYYFEGSRIASLGLSFVASLFNADGTLYVNSWDVVQGGGGDSGFSGDYNDLRNKPTIPTSLSQMSGDSTHRTVTDAEKTTWNNKQDALTFDENPTENSTNPVKSGGVYTALDGKAPKPKNTVYVDLAYWNSRKYAGSVFSRDNTHYILVDNLGTETYTNRVQKFGKGCVLSANKGCMFGIMNIQFTDTYIDVGQQQLFKPIIYSHPCSYDRTETISGTKIYGTFANSRILVEWWGAKGGRGVKGSDGTFENLYSKNQALNNSIAFNNALQCAGQSEVYAPAPMYLVGATISDMSFPMFRDDIPRDTDGEVDPNTEDDEIINPTVTSYTKLYVEGDLVAFSEFIGISKSSGDAWCETPSVVHINGNAPRCIIRGAIVVPFSAQDKEFEIVSALPETPVIGKIYLVGDTTNNDTNRFFDVYDVYYHYTSYTTSATEIATRKIGRFYTSVQKVSNYKSPSSLYGGKNRNYVKRSGNTYLLASGMYGISISSIGGYIEIGRIVKGDHRGGYWNITKDGKLMSYKYRKDVMHQGHCTAMSLRCVKASTIKVGQIEGFNDGVAFDSTYSTEYDAVEFNRFEFGSIACNYAVHTMCGSANACLVNPTKDTQKYFDGCRWQLGGFEPLSAGNSLLHSFIPTTSKSTYFLVENNAGKGDGFSNHWVEFDNSPLRWYTAIIDVARANDNLFIMHGNTSGDVGRVILWATESNINSHYNNNLPDEFANGYQIADGETHSSSWFPMDTFMGVESISKRPYAYSHLASMANPSNVWSTTTGYPWNSRLAPYSSGSLVYDEWSCPYSSSRSFINFRGGSFKNIVRGGRKHMLCYESVLNESSCGANEIHYAQSAFAMYDDAHLSGGNYTVFNSYHPLYDVVRFDRQKDPRNYTDWSDGGSAMVMFVPDENTLSCTKVVDTTDDINANGLYIVKAQPVVSTSPSDYKQTRYKLYEQYVEYTGENGENPTIVRQVGYISSIFVKLLEGGGGTVTETDPTVPTYVKAITQANIAAWNAKAERVVLNMTVSHHVPSFTTQDGTTFTEAEFRALTEDNSKEIVIVRNSSDYYINTYRNSEEYLMFVGHNGGRSFKVFYIGLDDEELYHEEHDIDVPFYLSELSQDSTHRTVTDTEKSAWNAKVNSSDLAEVATSGDYDDLINKPTIPTVPTNVSSFTNDAGYLTSHQDISGKADKVTVVEVSDAGAVSQALDPNKFYKFTGALTSLSLTLVSGTGFFMYAGKFTTGSGWGSNGLTIPATVTEAANNDEIAASKTYEFSIMDNVIVIKEV